MLPFVLNLPTPDQAQSNYFQTGYFQLNPFFARHAASLGKQTTDFLLQPLLMPLAAHLRKGDFAACPAEAYGAFVQGASEMLRPFITSFAERETPDADAIIEIQRNCDWLCGIAVLGPTDVSSKAHVAATWVRSRLLNWDMAGIAPEPLRAEITQSLDGLGLPDEVANDVVKSEIVLLVSRRLAPNGAFSPDWLSVIGDWCLDLLSKERYPEWIEAAKRLGIEGGVTPEIVTPMPNRFQLPYTNWEEDPTQESLALNECLEALMVVDLSLIINAQLCNPKMAEQVLLLTPESSAGGACAAFMQVAQGLWRLFWKTGEDSEIGTARQLASFVYSHYKRPLEGNDPKTPSSRHRQMLRLVTHLQLPSLIRINSLEALRQDAELLFASEGCDFNLGLFLSAFLAVYAGECQKASQSDTPQGADDLLMLNGDSLHAAHEEHLKLNVPGNERQEEEEIWQILEPHLRRVLGETAQEPSVNQEFAAIVNRGNTREVYQFVAAQLDGLCARLQEKLVDYQLSPKHLMRPWRVINQQGQGRGRTVDARFENATKFLEEGRFERAETEFETLTQMSGVPGKIAQDYLAFTLARQGVLVRAKPMLRELTGNNNNISTSAFWNLACCLDTDSDSQIEVLAQGLEKQPHLRLLHAAVYLSVIVHRSQEERSCHWLAQLPFLEAQLLYFYGTFERLDQERNGQLEQEELLRRIAAYIQHGDPHIPFPDKPKPDLDELENFCNRLKQRDHTEVLALWFRCHEPFEARYGNLRENTGYYTLKTNILDEMGLRVEAVKTFKEELKGRLIYLESLLRNNRLQNQRVIEEVRQRVEKNLRNCLSSNLKTEGRYIYKLVSEFDVFARDPRFQILPTEARLQIIHEAFGEQETLEDALANVSARVQTQLRSVSEYPNHRNALESLVRAFERDGKPNAAQAFQDLLNAWEKCLQRKSGEFSAQERAEAMQEASVAQTSVFTSWEIDLSSNQQQIAANLRAAIEKVNSRLAKGSRDLPKISVSVLPEVVPCLRPPKESKGRTSFVLEVQTSHGTAEVRVISAQARLLGTGVIFPGTDNFNIPISFGPKNPLLLSFAVDDEILQDIDVPLDQPNEIEVEIGYEYQDQSYKEAARITIMSAPYMVTRIPSPYIFGREIEPSEIEEHFFGREKEQSDLFHLITASGGKIGYIEGIRRTGKSSLFSSLCYRLGRDEDLLATNATRFIPVAIQGSAVYSFDHVGQILHDFLTEIARHPQVASLGVVAPSEDMCRMNLNVAYDEFEDQLRDKLGDYCVLAFWDDFQSIVSYAKEVGAGDPLSRGIRGLLDMVRGKRRADAKLFWLLAGYRSWVRFSDDLPNVNLFAELAQVSIDFLDASSVNSIITAPLQNTQIKVPHQTVARVFQLTAGHPEVVQRLGHLMLGRALDEGRPVLTPADADASAQELGQTSGLFADTWCPLREISVEQRTLIGQFLTAVPLMSGEIDPVHLVGAANHKASLSHINELVTRKIFKRGEGESRNIAVKAPILELWLRYHWKDEDPPLVAAVFVDMANLTKGTGDDSLVLPGMTFGDVTPGYFRLETVLDAIDRYAGELTPSMFADKWATNFPPGKPATLVANRKNYHTLNIDEATFQKGADDFELLRKVQQVLTDRPSITHIVLVTGDKDLRAGGVEAPLKEGKTVHVISPRNGCAHAYALLAQRYPERCKLVLLEDLLAKYRNP